MALLPLASRSFLYLSREDTWSCLLVTWWDAQRRRNPQRWWGWYRRTKATSCCGLPLDVCVVASERRSSLLSFISRRSHGDNYKDLTIMMHKTVQLLLLAKLLESRLLLWYNTAVAVNFVPYRKSALFSFQEKKFGLLHLVHIHFCLRNCGGKLSAK